MKVDGTPETAGIPEPAVSTSSSDKVTYTTEYNNPSVPSSSSTEWILPRNDSDYIYFRDLNTGETGWEDQFTFRSTDSSYFTSGNYNPEEKRSWRNAYFKYDSGNSQHLELGYDESKWMAAEFSGPNKDTVRYAVWERFVDDYTLDNHNWTTVVWKVQPPDGYTHVKFMLMQGDTPIRETQSIKYELGKIYHKTAWGKWTTRNGINTYYDVPVVPEESGTDQYWAPEDDSITDQRMANNTGSPYDSTGYTRTLSQARKYEPTDQKIIFHCNSQVVWHNIHIQFFKSNNVNDPVEGQPFPGYMMEPYAYAGSDYRINHYLTYELTIPKDATYFRITNGEEGTYGYTTELKKINKSGDTISVYENGSSTTTTSINVTGYKNHYNYFKLSNGAQTNDAALTYWRMNEITTCGDALNQIYTTANVTSDYDYIYFEKPSGWNNDVYAYFYGGGDLRGDNWQRACYSSWPGIAAVGTEYNDGTQHYSTTYSYSVTGANKYNATGTASASNPDTTFNNGNVVYKFRIPKGDRTNYSKVIFNDGLSSQNGGNTNTHETGVIDYKAGYLYKADGSCEKYYDNSPTDNYNGRQNSSYSDSDKTEYIYIKNEGTGWDNLHINFYDANGNPMLQGGTGYVMDYAGTSSSVQYFRVPIPTGAAKFSVNNGKGTASTSKYEIERLAETGGTPTTTLSAGDKFVYKLEGAVGSGTITREGYTTTEHKTTITVGTEQEESISGYTVRHSGSNVYDTLNIYDAFGWNVPIGGISVRFYTSAGTLIGSGAYNMIKTDPDTDGNVWYTKKIPDNAASFAISYTKTVSSTTTTVTTSQYPIYAYNANPTSGNATTTGHMFYKTTGTDTLEMTHAQPTVTETNDETYSKRGDDLYLCYSNNTTWAGMTVSFYDDGNSLIVGGVTAKYVGEKDGKHWYKVSIPTGAASFTVTKGGTTVKKEIYEKVDKYSRYKKDYTLGNMQYELGSSASTAPTLLYPIFTEDEEYTTTLGGETVSTRGSIQRVDTSVLSGYTTPATLPATSASGSPVLYETNANNVSYTWTELEGTTDTNKIYYENSNGWNTVNIYPFSGTNSATPDWPGVTMTHIDGTNVWYYDMTDKDYKKCIFNNGSSQTADLDIPTTLSTQSQMFYNAAAGTQLNKVYMVHDSSWNSNNYQMKIWFNDVSQGEGGDFSFDNKRGRKYDIPSSTTTVKFSYTDGGNDIKTSGTFTLDSSNGYGKGLVLLVSNSGASITNPTGYTYYETGSDWRWKEYSGETSTTHTFTASYQPEDRYSMISEENGIDSIGGTGDVNDFITIETSITKPYITFYTDVAGTEGAINGSNNNTSVTGTYASTNGISLAALDMDGTDGSPYLIRLPKSARSFKLASGFNGTPGNAVPLYSSTQQTAVVIDGTSQTVTIPYDYHYAGSSFYFGSGTNLDTTKNDDGYTAGKKLRTGFTVSKQTTIVDPLNPKTDGDYIYFTDPSNTFGGTVDEYYYGDVDGEYKAWPGLKATTTAAVGVAPTTYKDNSGNTVYRFRYPQANEGTFSKVIFTDGASSNPKITEAQNLAPRMNYILGNRSNTNNYGTFAPGGDNGYVYNVSSAAEKTTDTTVNYSTGSSNEYIYFIDNGTFNFGLTNCETGTRYVLDDVHVKFYNAGGTQIGTASGYIPDKIGSYSKDGISGDVYRIQVPENASTFQITNGADKGTASNAHNHYRQSEIKDITINGLYSFVQQKTSTGAPTLANEDYIEGSSVPATVGALSTPNYLLDLVNEIEESDEDIPEGKTVDIHLATVKTTTADGNISIVWLKDDLQHIDSNYLANTSSSYSTDTKVKVKKEGEYYWKEVVAPSGYKLDSSEQTFTLPGTTNVQVNDESIHTGSLKLVKKLKTIKTGSGESNAGEGPQNFTFRVTLTAPTGTDWNSFTLSSDPAGKVSVVSTNGVVHVVDVTVPSNATEVTIGNIPEGTVYSAVESAPASEPYTSTPVSIYKGNDTTNNLTEITGTIPADSNDKYTVTNKREVGTLTLKKTVSGDADALTAASINQNSTFTTFHFNVVIEAPTDVDLADYIDTTGLGTVTSETSNGKVTKYTFTNIPVTSAPGGFKIITNIPLGTQYKVTEADANSSTADYTMTTTGQMPAAEELSNTNRTPVVTINNDYSTPSNTYDLSVSKSVAGTVPPAYGSDVEYKFTITIGTANQNLGSYTITKPTGTDYNSHLTTITAGTAFDVYLKDDETITFNDLPNGVSYSVSEDTANYYKYNSSTSSHDSTAHGVTPTVSYTVDSGEPSNTAPSGTLGADTTVTAENKYPYVGTLELEKKVVAGNTEQSFTYHVTLTTDDSTGVDLTQYLPKSVLTASPLSATISKDNNSQDIHSAHRIEFDVSITAGSENDAV